MTTNGSREVWSDLAIHPGESLQEEMESRQLKRGELAVELGVTGEQLQGVLEGRAPITADLALALENAWGIEATFWMNLQTRYELTLARQRGLKAVSR